MRLTPVRRVPAGAVLARDVDTGHPGGVPLLRSGVRLTERYRERLEHVGINAVWVEDRMTADIAPVPLVSTETRRRAARGFERAMGDVGRSLSQSGTVPPAAIAELSEIVELIAKEVLDAPEIALALEDLAAADAYTHRHSVNVCAVGILIGRRLLSERGWVDGAGQRRIDRRQHRLRMLGLGLLLHDIGKLSVPADVLNKRAPLSPAEWKLIEAHPDAGVALLPDYVSPLIRSVVRDHHERWDGSGYPRGLRGDEIGQLPRIAAVADVYDALTSERVYARANPPHVAVDLILEGRGRAYDPEVVDIFRKVVFPYPPGTEVVMADGRVGVVCAVEPDRPDEPLVRAPLAAGGFEEVTVDLRLETRRRANLAQDPQGRPVGQAA